MKKLLSIAAILTIGTASLATAGTLVSPFAGSLSYDSSSVKDSGNYSGIYLKTFDRTGNTFEVNYEHDNITYKNQKKDYIQNTVGVAKTLVTGSMNTRVGLSFSNISDQNNNTGNDYTVFFGNNGIDNGIGFGYSLYYTHLGNSNVSKVYQFSPYVSGLLLNTGSMGNVYGKVGYNLTKLDTSNKVDNDKTYNNFDFSLINYNPNGFTTTLSYSVGDSSYKTSHGGFVTDNTGEVIKNSVGVSEMVSFGRNKSKYVTLNVKKDKVKDFDTTGTVNDTMNNYTFGVSVGMVF